MRAAFFACLGLLLATAGRGQKTFFRLYATADGLPSSTIYGLHQDREGYVWVCSDRGVAKFDGQRFLKFTVADGLPASDVWSLAPDANGRLWLNTFSGVAWIEGGEVRNFPLPPGKSASMVEHEFLPDGRHLVFLDRQPHFLDLEKGQLEGPIVRDQLRCVQFADGQPVFFSSSTGQLLTDRPTDAGPFLRTKNYPSAGFLRIGRRSWFFALDEKRRIVFDGKKARPEPFSFAGPAGQPLRVRTIDKFDDDRFLILADEGAFVADSNFRLQKGFDFLRQFDVKRAFADRFGNVWAVTAEGLCLVPAAEKRSTLAQPFGPDGREAVTALAVSADQKTVWAGSAEGRLAARNSGRWTQPQPLGNPLFSEQKIRSMRSAGGFLAVAGAFGLDIFLEKKLLAALEKGQKCRPEAHFDRFFGACKSVEDDTAGGELAFLVSASSAVCRFAKRPDGWRMEPLSNGRFYRAARAPSGLFFGKMNGLFHLTEKAELEPLIGICPALGKPILGLAVDPAGGLWAATDGGGAFRIGLSGQIDAAPLPADWIPTCLAVGADSSVWIGHSGGLARLRMVSERPFRCEMQAFRRSNGLFSDEINDVAPLGKAVLLATKAGVVAFFADAGGAEKGAEKPLVALDELTAGGQKRLLADGFLSLAYDENDLRLRFHARSYRSCGDVAVEYRVVGRENDWKTAPPGLLEFPALPVGKFVLRLRARDLNGVVSEELELRVVVRPPWWRTWWAVGGAAVLAFLAGWFLVDRRLAKARKEAAALGELRLRALQAQMNPHFIFNALHSIQDFVFQKDERAANRFLVKFGRLMRAFLEASRQKTMSLAQEIGLLRDYVELEQLRLERKMAVEWAVAEGIDLEAERVPPHFLQPFVENAIKHGLAPKAEAGQLRLAFFKTEKGELAVEIEDDGIGRRASAQLFPSDFERHRSRGMEIVEERRRMLAALGEGEIGLEITDFEPPRTGTRVRLTFGAGAGRVEKTAFSACFFIRKAVHRG